MSETTQSQRCGKCGAALSGYAPDGLCAACLLASAFDERDIQSGEPIQPAQLFAFKDYELLEEIARGGMGVVYRARQISLNRIVAIKMILGGHLASAVEMQRFRAEAETAAQLQHPNIVAIHEVGEHAGQPFFSMDLVEGRNLAQLVRDEPLPSRKAAAYLRAIAEAVQYAHSRGVLHRDLKPSNILINDSDHPRITDFGLAKRLNPSPLSTGDPHPTQTGQVLGSPSFIPPEQAAGRKNALGPASDVYSLGAILYHLLTGRPPFMAETLTQTLRMVAEQEPVSPRLLNASVPRDLETICLKCLEKDLKHRYQTAQELADDLSRLLRDEAIRARPAGRVEKMWRWCRHKPGLATSLTLLFVIAVGSPIAAFRINRERQRAEQAAALVAEALSQMAVRQTTAKQLISTLEQYNRTEQIRGLSMPHSGFEFSRDGLQAVIISKNTARVWDVRTGETVGEPLQHNGLIKFAQFSPDGLLLLTTGEDNTARIWQVATSQQTVPPLLHAGVVNHAQFSPDGLQVVTASEDKTARVWDARNGRSLTQPLQHDHPLKLVQFSPDGRRIATASCDNSVLVWEIVSAQKVSPILEHHWEVYSIQFSQDGMDLLTLTVSGQSTIWNVATGKPLSATPSSLGSKSQLGAAFLFNFLKYVEWPSHSVSATNSPFRLGILGDKPFGDSIKAIAELGTRTAGGRRIEIICVNADSHLENLENLHLLLITSSEYDKARNVIERLKDRSVLTVGDGEQFADLGVMITLFLEDNKMRFAINSGAAKQAGLKVDSKLSSLSQPIKRPK